MRHTLIVARMAVDAERSVADAFAASDQTDLPYRIGVRSRTLFRFHDLYMHLITADDDVRATVQDHRDDPLFRAVSEQLAAHVAPYDPKTWRSPEDAMATPFYHWEAVGR
jgi:cyclase